VILASVFHNLLSVPEKFPGNFIDSPYTGNELTEKVDSAIPGD